MNILLLGNGFDLLHNLPTRYSNFLDFINVIDKYKNYGSKMMNLDIWLNGEAKNINKEIVNILKNYLESSEYSLIDRFFHLVDENIWIEYFFDNKNNIGNDWVDFETEISIIVRIIEESLNHDYFTGKVFLDLKKVKKFCKETRRNSANLLKLFKDLKEPDEEKTYSFIESLNKDLEELIIALEIYLYHFVNKMVSEKKVKEKDFVKVLHVDKVISFNYTDTYKNLYDNCCCAEYNYIHGKANEYNSENKSNIVLGIEEYFDDEQKNKCLEFVKFKKYYQRIQKNTDSKYYDWINEVRKEQTEYYNKVSLKEKIRLCIWILKEKFKDIEYNLPLPQVNKEQHNLYIIGHSLDINDKDILRDLILNDNVTTTIFYYKDSYDKTICNLIKTIGLEETSKRTKGNNQTILFVEQPDEK